MSKPCGECGGVGLQDASGFGHMDVCQECAGSGKIIVTANAIFRHKKRGSLYRVLGIGTMQASGNSLDTAKVVIYQGIDDATLWSRPVEQFMDGRFELVEDAQATLMPEEPALRAAIQRMAGALMAREWAEHALPGDIDVTTLESEITRLVSENSRLNALVNSPELIDFRDAVVREAAHQRERWGSAHDQGKTSGDWFWLVAHLASKAMASIKEAECIATMLPDTEAGSHTRTLLEQRLIHHREKAIHHVITTAAALANWHAALIGASTVMRPGITTPAEPWGIRCDETGYLRTFRTREQRDHFLVTVGTAGAIKPELFGPDDATAPHPAPQQPDARDAPIKDRAALESTLRFIEEKVWPRKCDSNGVSGCWRCQSVYLASRMRELLSESASRDALVRELVEALEDYVTSDTLGRGLESRRYLRGVAALSKVPGATS